jgi:hypothetical protein
MRANQRWFTRGEFILATHDALGKLLPVTDGEVCDDYGMAHLWIRLSDGSLHAVMRETLQTECTGCGDWHTPERCPWLETCAECSRKGADMHADRLCVDCHEHHEVVSERDRRDAAREAYGDYLRDEGKDRR